MTPKKLQLHRKRQPQQGFTLIEIAIVLLIVSLLIGGVFQGQQLIQNAKNQRLLSDISAFQSAWYGFIDRYNAPPGDFTAATAQLDAAAVNGDGNAQVDTKAEVAALWQHLGLSGFVSGQFDANGDGIGVLDSADCRNNTCPNNPYNGHYKILWDATRASHALLTGHSIPASALYQLDLDLDDGLPSSGSVQVHNDFNNATCVTADQWNGANGDSRCAAIIRLN